MFFYSCTTWSVEACLTTFRNQRYGPLAKQYHQKPVEQNAGRLIPILTVYVEAVKMPDPLVWALSQLFCLSSKTGSDIDRAYKLRFHHDNARSRADIEDHLHLGGFFRNVLFLNLCSISVPLRFYLCYIFDRISLSLLTTVKLNKHSMPEKKILLLARSSYSGQNLLFFSYLEVCQNVPYLLSQHRICLPFISMSRTLRQSNIASFIRTRCGDRRNSHAGNRGQPRHDHR